MANWKVQGGKFDSYLFSTLKHVTNLVSALGSRLARRRCVEKPLMAWLVQALPLRRWRVAGM
jgi:predicted component of type VI protein secretion system